MKKSKTCVGAVVIGAAAAGLLAMSSWAPTPAVAGGKGGGETGFPDETWSVTADVTGLPVNAAGQSIASFDISYVDANLGLYVLGDRTNKGVDVVDIATGVATVMKGSPAHPFAGAVASPPCASPNSCSGPDGVIIVPKANTGSGNNEIWAGDGDSTVKVIPLDGPMAGQTTQVISTNGMFRADENCLDTDDNLLMTANNADPIPFGTIISTKTYTITHQVKFTNSTNGAEQCQWSPRTKMFYISIPGIETPDNGHGQVAVIDPKSGNIVRTIDIPLEVCGTPQGMAVGPKPQIMIGCNEGSGVSGNNLHSGIIIDENSGSTAKIIAVLPFLAGPDEVYYGAGTAEYFLAQSGSAPTCSPTGCTGNQLLGVADAQFKQDDAAVITANKTVAGRSAHSVAADSKTKKVFVPIPAGVAIACHEAAANGPTGTGCIAILTTTDPDKGKSIVGRNNHGHDHDDDGQGHDD